MDRLLTLTDWNLRTIRKPLLAMALLMGPLEFAWMCLYARFTNASLAQPAALLYSSGAFLVVCLCMLAAELFNFGSSLSRIGRTKGVYTLMTLPVPRWQVLLSRICSGTLAVLLMVACQALWFMLLVTPLQWVTDRSFVGMLMPEFASSHIQNGLLLNMLRAAPMRMLLPFSGARILLAFLQVLCSVTALECVLCHKGAARAVQGVVSALCLGCTLVAYFLYLNIPTLNGSVTDTRLLNTWVYSGSLLLLAGFSLAWGLCSFGRAKNL